MVTPEVALLLNVVSLVLAWLTVVWFLCAGFLYGGRGIIRGPRIINTLWRWLKWPALVSIMTNIPVDILVGNEVTWLNRAGMAINLCMWWVYRNAGDDDPMDKLKKKLKEKVAEIEGRLVVVPEGASA